MCYLYSKIILLPSIFRICFLYLFKTWFLEIYFLIVRFHCTYDFCVSRYHDISVRDTGQLSDKYPVQSTVCQNVIYIRTKIIQYIVSWKQNIPINRLRISNYYIILLYVHLVEQLTFSSHLKIVKCKLIWTFVPLLFVLEYLTLSVLI